VRRKNATSGTTEKRKYLIGFTLISWGDIRLAQKAVSCHTEEKRRRTMRR
jgi:hypothetical protein